MRSQVAQWRRVRPLFAGCSVKSVLVAPPFIGVSQSGMYASIGHGTCTAAILVEGGPVAERSMRAGGGTPDAHAYEGWPSRAAAEPDRVTDER
jgi:hypothetical protein